MTRTQTAGRSMLMAAAALCFAAAPLSAATYKMTWLLGHRNLDYFEEAAQAFKKAVERESKGDIAVEIKAQMPDASGRYLQGRRIAELVGKGEAQMGHSFTDVMASLEPGMMAFDAPYLFRGYRHLEGVFEGPLGAEMLASLRPHGITGLSFTYSGGASGIATIDRQVRKPEDLKGLKVGVFGNKVNRAWLEKLGAKAVPIGHELRLIAPLARNGDLDAVVTTWRNFDREDLATEFRRVGLVGSTYLVSVTYINAKFFDSLPKKYQELLARASREAGRIERAKTIELNESARRGMTEDRGVDSVELSRAEQSAFVDALRPAHPAIEEAIGPELIRRIRETPDGSEPPTVSIEISKL